MNDQILIKYLLNEADEKETLAVKKWRYEHRDHQKHYEQIQWLWETSGKLALHTDVDENAAWDRFVQRREQQEGEKILTRQRYMYPLWMKIAVAITLAFVVNWTVLSFLPHNGKALYSKVVLESALDSRQEVLLDGSTITLNKHSSMTYSQKLLGGERLVNLTAGEAYFEVTKNQKKPFIVDAQKVKITVLGTAFNVRKTGSSTTVIVDSGSVEVRTAGSQIVLAPNEKAIIDHETGKIEKSSQDNALFRYYVTQKFVVEDVSLPLLVAALNEAYGASIEIASAKARGLFITTTLEYGSLDKNLEVIKETLGLRVTKSDTKILLE